MKRETDFTNTLFKSEKKLTELGTRLKKCDVHGEYQSIGRNYFGIHESWSKCPTCESIREQKEIEDQISREREAQMREIKRRLGLVGVPVRFEDCSFENYRCDNDDQRRALSTCREYSENFDYYKTNGDGLALLGNIGNGKTHLAIAILKEVQKRHTVIYVTVGDLIKAVRATWQRDSEKTEKEVLDYFKKVVLLIIDEVGVQSGSDNEQQILFDILNARYNERKSTIFLSNCPPRTYMDGGVQVLGVKEYLGDRTFDRLTQISQVITFNWESHRKIARREWMEGSR
ncbi:MAG TPA: ATP-binding protein [Limnobacter sp.]|uniref:ATP-binding protein n=1 Tax=Limnobacter sp. TaxID=2003368 RepID=UPI002ED97F20